MKPLYHPVTESQIEAFLARPKHAVLLTGRTGSGKAMIAEAIARRLLDYPSPKDLGNHSFFRWLRPENNVIAIETIRDLQYFLRLKTLGKSKLRRAIVIEDAQAMTTEAQNALLKLLEEPPQDTVFILTAVSVSALLPTTASRAQQIPVRRPARQAVQEFFEAKGHGSEVVTRTLHLSDGLPGLTEELLAVDSEHPLAMRLELAKDLATADKYRRLLLVDKLSKDRAGLSALLDVLGRVLRAGLHSSLKRDNPAQSLKLLTMLRAVNKASRRLETNVHPKLWLTDLLLSL